MRKIKFKNTCNLKIYQTQIRSIKTILMRQQLKIEPLILTMRKALESIAKKTLIIKLIIKTSKRKLNRVRTLNLSQKDF